MLYSFFWVIPRRLICIYRSFGSHCFIFVGGISRKNNWDEIVRVHIGKSLVQKNMERCVPKCRLKIRKPGNHPKERKQQLLLFPSTVPGLHKPASPPHLLFCRGHPVVLLNKKIRKSFSFQSNTKIYSHSSFANRCTFIKTLIRIYIKTTWLLHVSVYDHHQGACN